MKNIFIYIFILALFSDCNKDDEVQNGCVSVLLPNYGFDTGSAINLNLPSYSSLGFVGNSKYIPGYGVKGIYLYNTGIISGSGDYVIVAFEASDPAHAPDSCSRMDGTGLIVSCNCGDGNKYQLLNGLQIEGDTGNCLRSYKVERSGNIVRVYN